MLHTLVKSLTNLRSSLSSRKTAKKGRPAKIELAKIVDKVVATVDPRMRVIPGYEKKLKTEIEIAWQYLEGLIQQIPGTMDVDAQALNSDLRVKLIFSNAEEMGSVFYNAQNLDELLVAGNDENPEFVYALLCVQESERSIFGTELQGDIVKREVAKTLVSFSNHHLLSPGITKMQALDGFKYCAFEALLHNVTTNILELNNEYRHLVEQRSMLQKKFGVNKNASSTVNSLYPFATSANGVKNKEIIDVEQQISAVKNEIASPEQHMDQVREVLSQPNTYIKLSQRSLFLDRFGTKLSDTTSTQGVGIEMAELEVKNTFNRMAMVIRSPRVELLDILRQQQLKSPQ